MARSLLLILVWASLISAMEPEQARSAAPPARRPNILWLIADNIGPDLGCYGAPLVRTPRIDVVQRQRLKDKLLLTCLSSEELHKATAVVRPGTVRRIDLLSCCSVTSDEGVSLYIADAVF